MSWIASVDWTLLLKAQLAYGSVPPSPSCSCTRSCLLVPTPRTQITCNDSTTTLAMSAAVPVATGQPTMRVVSFDVGIRHLAYCVISFPKCTSMTTMEKVSKAQIESWDMIDLDRVPSVDVCSRRLTEELYKRFAFQNFDVALIERQPQHRSIVMVAIQMFLCNYFHVARVVNGNKCLVKFMHASKKLDCCDGKGIQPDVQVRRAKFRPSRESKEARTAAAIRYKDNKRRAVEACLHYLQEVMQDFANASLLEQYTKKDDLCDAFLQAIAYVEGH